MQKIPIPIGSDHPIRARRVPTRRSIRESLPLVIITAGLLSAILGAYVGAFEPDVIVSMDSDNYEINGYKLHTLADSKSYSGDGGAVVIIKTENGLRAGGSSTINGQDSLGKCEVSKDEKSEKCSFTWGKQSFTSLDSKSFYGWDRKYSDGKSTKIRTLGKGAIPVPFPVGR